MIKINKNKSIDPTFGKDFPEVSRIYEIVVTPKTHNFSWVFFILVPSLDMKEDDPAYEKTVKNLIDGICNDALNPGDNYRVYEFIEKDLAKYERHTPLIGYDPDSEDFVWITPPRHLMS